MKHIEKIRYNCRQATFLIEKNLIGRLTFGEVISLRIHLTGCSACKLYEIQSRKINEMVHEFFRDSLIRKIALDNIFKKELHEQIEENFKKKGNNL